MFAHLPATINLSFYNMYIVYQSDVFGMWRSFARVWFNLISPSSGQPQASQIDVNSILKHRIRTYRRKADGFNISLAINSHIRATYSQEPCANFTL